jgi:hypothetical protein
MIQMVFPSKASRHPSCGDMYLVAEGTDNCLAVSLPKKIVIAISRATFRFAFAYF